MEGVGPGGEGSGPSFLLNWIGLFRWNTQTGSSDTLTGSIHIPSPGVGCRLTVRFSYLLQLAPSSSSSD